MIQRLAWIQDKTYSLISFCVLISLNQCKLKKMNGSFRLLHSNITARLEICAIWELCLRIPTLTCGKLRRHCNLENSPTRTLCTDYSLGIGEVIESAVQLL